MEHTWHDDDELDGGTLEIDERYAAPGPGLELSVVVVGVGESRRCGSPKRADSLGKRRWGWLSCSRAMLLS